MKQGIRNILDRVEDWKYFELIVGTVIFVAFFLALGFVGAMEIH